jgi:hypothetical protein
VLFSKPSGAACVRNIQYVGGLIVVRTGELESWSTPSKKLFGQV